jgi:hypothetical protein
MPTDDDMKISPSDQKRLNLVKFFQKHIVERKSITKCSEELGLSRMTLHGYKKERDFRSMALDYLETSRLRGVTGVMDRLLDQLDATNRVPFEKSDGEVIWQEVPNNKVRQAALQEIIKIYGLYAPTEIDARLTVSVASDAELFAEIEEAERTCRLVESHEVGQAGPGLAAGQQEDSTGDFDSRKRTLLRDGSVSQSQ